jgi:hypothetical protein
MTDPVPLPEGYKFGMSGGIEENAVAMRRLIQEHGWQGFRGYSIAPAAMPKTLGVFGLELTDHAETTYKAEGQTFQVAARRIVAMVQAAVLASDLPAAQHPLGWLLEPKPLPKKKEG